MGAHAERRPLRVLHAFATFVPAGPQLRTLDLIAGLGEEFEHEKVRYRVAEATDRRVLKVHVSPHQGNRSG